MVKFKKLAGLPPYGPMALNFSEKWGKSGQEGFVVEFSDESDKTWVGNFKPGSGGISEVIIHPNGNKVLVLSNGMMWEVDPTERIAAEFAEPIFNFWDVSGPKGYVFNLQGLYFFRLAASGTIWKTRRISWDGFRNIQFDGTTMTGEAYYPGTEDIWESFKIDLLTGECVGGSYNGPDAPNQ